MTPVPEDAVDHDMKRRMFIAATTATMWTACASGYGALVANVWRSPSAPSHDLRSLQLELVRLATLAANSHNSQPWLFRLDGGGLEIHPDPARRLPVVDGDDHHLWVSLGCAAENIVRAAPAFGLQASARLVVRAGRQHVDVRLASSPRRDSPLLSAIAARSCTRSVYDGRALDAGTLSILSEAGREYGVDVDVLTRRADRASVASLILRANATQVSDTAFREELLSWLRFNESHAAETRDGLFSASVGAPTAPAFLARMFFGGSFTPAAENEKLQARLESSPALVVLTGPSATPAGWVAVGRACQHLALEATRLGVAHAHVNQAVEVADLRPALARIVGKEGRRPDLVLRLGHGPPLPRSLRRPVREVLVSS